MPPKKKAKATIPWQEIAEEAQQLRDRSLAEAGVGIIGEIPRGNVMHVPEETITHEEAEITSLKPGDLVQRISSGELTAVEVSRAYLRRAAVAQKLTNCITELLPISVAAEALELDNHLRITSRTKGPLHGLPISIKSHVSLANHNAPCGYISRWPTIPIEDALIVQILRRAGAMIHARTTEPQSMMQLECTSNLYGTTTNPHNTALSSGGSSGGEGALIALRGSALGVGSDVGGSIRVPAAACGMYGFKPSGFRVPTTGYGSIASGADPIPSVLGPMSASLEGVEMFMRTVLAAEPWTVEPALVPLPWREVTITPSAERPLRLGVILDDGLVLPHPPISRVLKEFVERVKKIPFVEVVNFPAYKHDEAWAIVSSLYFTDGGEADAKAIADSGEPWLPLTKWIVKENACVKKLDRKELEYWLEERGEFRFEYAKYWNETGTWNSDTGRWEGVVDVVICPVGPGVATKHGTAKYWYYTAAWNLLDYPALVFPAGKVDCKQDTKERKSKYKTQLDKDNWQLYDPEIFDQMPVGLQLVGRRFEDEKVVSILKYLKSLDDAVDTAMVE